MSVAVAVGAASVTAAATTAAAAAAAAAAAVAVAVRAAVTATTAAWRSGSCLLLPVHNCCLVVYIGLFTFLLPAQLSSFGCIYESEGRGGNLKRQFAFCFPVSFWCVSTRLLSGHAKNENMSVSRFTRPVGLFMLKGRCEQPRLGCQFMGSGTVRKGGVFGPVCRTVGWYGGTNRTFVM